MNRAMFVKELRETAWIVLLAAAAYAWAVSSLVHLLSPPGTEPKETIPFVDGEFRQGFLLFSGALVIALGLRQSLGETVRGTWPFLFHRPASRRRLVGVKLATGAGLYLVVSMLPIVVYASWAATPGTHAGPFEWSMT